MAPPSAATAAPSRRHAASSMGASAPSRRRGRGEAPAPQQSPLRLVPSRQRRAIRGGRAAAGRGRLLGVFAISMVVASLLAVVVGQALLANGQVRLSSLQHQLSLEQSAHRQSELSVAELETPSRIVAAASGQLHMVRPANVVELPYVSLSVPLPTPKVTPAPVVPTTAPATSGALRTGTATGTSTGTSAGAGATSTTATSTP
jgi:hypothetical protein